MDPNPEIYDDYYKIILCGDPRIGKTSFLIRCLKNVYKEMKPTVGVEYATKCVMLKNEDNKVIKVQIWDTSGSEKYKSITTAHYRKAAGALLFFDLTDSSTYKNAQKWLTEIQKYTEEGVIIMLIGNKYDLVEINPDLRQITEVDVGNFCKKEYLMFSEVSAKTGYNVKESFENFIESRNSDKYFTDGLKEIYKENEKRKKNIEPYQKFVSFVDPNAIKFEIKEEMSEFITKKTKKKCCC